MSIAAELVRKTIPLPVRAALRNTAWLVNPARFTNARKISRFADKHRGERCFIIGNGPSLNNTDLSLLRDEVTFGMNRIYLKFDELGFAFTYYVVVNKLVVEQCAREIEQVPSPKFVSWYARKFIKAADDVYYLRQPQGSRTGFSTRPGIGVWEGCTVTYVAMQLAYYMGFSEVVLVGVDHSFATKGEPGEVVSLSGGDPNHFDPNYFGPGFRWQLPNLEGSEEAYNVARKVFESAGRRIIDATVGGKLEVFPKVKYESLFAGSKAR